MVPQGGIRALIQGYSGQNFCLCANAQRCLTLPKPRAVKESTGSRQRGEHEGGAVNSMDVLAPSPTVTWPSVPLSSPEARTIQKRPKFLLQKRPKFLLQKKPKFLLQKRPKFLLQKAPKFLLLSKLKYEYKEQPNVWLGDAHFPVKNMHSMVSYLQSHKSALQPGFPLQARAEAVISYCLNNLQLP